MLRTTRENLDIAAVDRRVTDLGMVKKLNKHASLIYVQENFKTMFTGKSVILTLLNKQKTHFNIIMVLVKEIMWNYNLKNP